MIIAKLDLEELPKTCAYCPYALHAIGFISCDLVRVKGDIRTKLYGDITKRPDGCPLVEVMPVGRGDGMTQEEAAKIVLKAIKRELMGCENCVLAQNCNLEDDDTPCLDCEEE